MNNIYRCGATVRGSRAFWYKESKQLASMIEQLQTPTFFFTLSMADLHWPELHKEIAKMPGAPNPYEEGLTERQCFERRRRNLREYPHLAATYLNRRWQSLKKHVLDHIVPGGHSKVLDHWFRYEWQARGSGHIHGFLWCQGAPNMDRLDWSDDDAVEAARAYFASSITAFNPLTGAAAPEVEATLHDMTNREVRRARHPDIDHGELANRVQMHGRVLNGDRQCTVGCKRRRGGEEYCRFAAPWECTDHANLFIEHGPLLPNKRRKITFEPRRNDAWLNRHNKLLLIAWRANCDIQPVLDKHSAMAYIAKYASKSEEETTTYRQLMLHAVCTKQRLG